MTRRYRKATGIPSSEEHRLVTRVFEIVEAIDSLGGDVSQRQRLEAVAVNILNTFDGGAMPYALPYAVRPLDPNGREGTDIAGSLTQHFVSLCRGEYPAGKAPAKPTPKPTRSKSGSRRRVQTPKTGSAKVIQIAPFLRSPE